MFKITILISIYTLFFSPAFAFQDLDKDSVKTIHIYRTLLSVIAEPDGIQWPPKLELSRDNITNAYARNTGSDQFSIIITRKMILSCRNNESGIAFILAHELAHVTLRHKVKNIYGKLIILANQRTDEFEADSVGLKYAMRAGYSYRSILDFITDYRNEMGDYSTIEALSVDHPSWTERLARIDRDQERLWKSMAAFQNGNCFLSLSDYLSAADCFQSVTREFPTCHEAWNNLGYAYLMQYLENLTFEEFKSYHPGRLEFYNFYKMPLSLKTRKDKIRGIDQELWDLTTKTLETAIQRNNHTALGYHNLAIAYMFHPMGKKTGKARQLFEQSVKETANDTLIDLYSLFSIYSNYRSLLYDIDSLKCSQLQTALLRIIEKSKSETNKELTGNLSEGYHHSSMFNTILLSDNKQSDASFLRDIETYLSSEECNSVWWDIVFDIYKKRCNAAEKIVNGKSVFCNPVESSNFHQTTSIMISDSINLFLSASIDELLGKIKESDYSKILLNRSSRLNEYRLKNGIRFIGSDNIIAIFLDSLNSPQVTIKATRLNSEKYRIHIGMTIDQYNELLKGIADNYQYTYFFDEDSTYRYYKELGLAIRVKGGKVTEIALLPRIISSSPFR